MVGTLLRGIGWMLGTVTLLITLWVLWSLFAYRDIPRDELVERYGGNVQFVNVDGVELAYRIDGNGSAQAPTMLLIHNHFFDSLMFEPMIKELNSDWRVVRFDMTSHGLTGPDPSGDYTMSRSLELIKALLDHVSAQKVVLVGSSLGGNMAFHYAAEYPEQAEALVLINSGGFKREQSSSRNAGAIPDWAYKALYLVPTMAWEKFVDRIVFDMASLEPGTVERFHHMQRLEGTRKAEMQRIASFDAGTPEPILRSITAPTLILWGRDNPQLSVELADKFESTLGSDSVKKVIVPEAGHVLPLEQPSRTAAEINAFLSSL